MIIFRGKHEITDFEHCKQLGKLFCALLLAIQLHCKGDSAPKQIVLKKLMEMGKKVKGNSTVIR